MQYYIYGYFFAVGFIIGWSIGKKEEIFGKERLRDPKSNFLSTLAIFIIAPLFSVFYPIWSVTWLIKKGVQYYVRRKHT